MQLEDPNIGLSGSGPESAVELLATLPGPTDDPFGSPRSSASSRRFASIGRLIARHVLGSLGVVLCVMGLTFVVTRVFAPDPTSLFMGPAGNGYVNAAAEAAERAHVRATLGLGKALPIQFLDFVNGVIHGNLGTSFETGRPVLSDLIDRLPATAELAVYS